MVAAAAKAGQFVKGGLQFPHRCGGLGVGLGELACDLGRLPHLLDTSLRLGVSFALGAVSYTITSCRPCCD